jgi:hypothetical protein
VSNAEGSDPPTASIPRDRLLALVKETSSLPPPNPHLIARGTRHPMESMEEDADGVSPLAVLVVIALFIALFVAVVQLN